jgi:hypothetical protein
MKSRAIQAIIETYKEMPDRDILTSWRISGRNVMKDYHVGNDNAVRLWNGYDRVWEEDTQSVASKVHEQGKLFFEGMAGGVSDIESGIMFIPRPGRKKRRAPPPVVENDVHGHEADTTECSEEYSEYSSEDCPDIDDSEDELADFVGNCTLGDGEAHTSQRARNP